MGWSEQSLESQPGMATFQEEGKQDQEAVLSLVLNLRCGEGCSGSERGVIVVKRVNSGDKSRIHHISAVRPQTSHSASSRSVSVFFFLYTFIYLYLFVALFIFLKLRYN